MRTAKEAFRMDDLERLRVLEDAAQDGLTERVLYHSHCEFGAYFSDEDQRMAVRDGVELIPGAIYLVVSIKDGRRADAAAYRYDATRRRFEEQRLGEAWLGRVVSAPRAAWG